MSQMQDFVPLTSQLGIAGSSYRLQMGQINDHWCIRLVKGKDVLDSHIFKESDDMPNANRLTGWVLSVLVIPNINTYQVQKTVGFIRQKAIRNLEERKLAKKSAGKEESKDVKLEKTPEKLKKRPSSRGVVKDIEEEEGEKGKTKVDASEVSPSLAASNKSAMSKQGAREDAKAISVGERELPMIPTGPGYEPNEDWASDAVLESSKEPRKKPSTKQTSASTGSKKAKSADKKVSAEKAAPVEISDKDIMTALLKSSEYQEILKRVDDLEQKVKKLQEKNNLLQNEIESMK